MSLDVIILAAGEGRRMRSALPKVLHPLAGRPLIAHVLDSASRLEPARIHVVHGHGGDLLQARITHPFVHWVEQAEQLGTGDAVRQAIPFVPPDSTALILYGDVPLIRPETLQRLLKACGARGAALLTVELGDPAGYGRILRGKDGEVVGIVEERDATAAQRAIREVNTGVIAARAGLLSPLLARLHTRNAQGEYYLTDVVGMLAEAGSPAVAVQPASADEVLGVNDREQLARLERTFQRAQAGDLMKRGVTLLDPNRLDVRGEVAVGRDVVIDVNVVLEGRIDLGDDVRIGPGCVLRDVRLGAGTRVEPFTVIEDSEVGPGCRLGPYARIRPGTRLAGDVHLGNFVELKNVRVGEQTKISHLSYVGDADVGQRVNIGAGTITCNYDGANKHRTRIGDGAFVGSDTQLIAPVTVGAGATIGAGSTITRDAPPGELTLSRAPQQTRRGWRRPARKDIEKGSGSSGVS